MPIADFTRPYGIKAASVAAWDEAAETWGTPVIVPNLMGATFTPTMSNDEMNIYSSVEHLLSVLAGGELSLDLGGIATAAYNVMTGLTSDESGSGAGEVRDTAYIGGFNMAYFGIIYALDTDGVSDMHYHLPRVKLDSFAELAAVAESEFVKPNITAKAARLRLADGVTLYPILRTIEHIVSTAIPSDFNVAFAPLT